MAGEIDEAAEVAAARFVALLEVIAGPDGAPLTPAVLLRVVGLLGALLVHHADYSVDEVASEIMRVTEHEASVALMRQHLVTLGILPAPPAPDEGLH